MIRCKKVGDDKADYIPDPGSADETQKLNDLRDICAKYCRDLDFVQLGNEIYGNGPGKYYVNLGGTCGDGYLGNQTDFQSGACYVQARGKVFDWMQKQVDVVIAASAMAGRPLEVVSPAIFAKMIIFGSSGDLSTLPGNLDVANDLPPGPNRMAYSARRVVDFANSNFAVTDVHIHYTIDDRSPGDQIATALDQLTSGMAGLWDPPASVGCTEWSPIPTYDSDGNDWVRDNITEYRKYFNGDQTGVPQRNTWDAFITYWRSSEFPNVTFADLLTGDLSLFNDNRFRFACYGQFGQGIVKFTHEGGVDHAQPDQWQLTTVTGDEIKSEYLLNGPVYTVVETALKDAAANYVIQNWNPHPGGAQAECGN